jgi:hypothetical protein
LKSVTMGASFMENMVLDWDCQFLARLGRRCR